MMGNYWLLFATKWSRSNSYQKIEHNITYINIQQLLEMEEYIEAIENNQYDDVIEILDSYQDSDMFQHILTNYPDKIENLIQTIIEQEDTFCLDCLYQCWDMEKLADILHRLIRYKKEGIPKMVDNVDYILENFLNEEQKKRCLIRIMRTTTTEYFERLAKTYHYIIDEDFIKKIIHAMITAEEVGCLFQNNSLNNYPYLVNRLINLAIKDIDMRLIEVIAKYYSGEYIIENFHANDFIEIEKMLDYLSGNNILVKIVETEDIKAIRRILEKY